MTPSTPAQPSSRRLRVRLFAVGALAALVGSGLFLVATWPSHTPQPEAARSAPGTATLTVASKASPAEQLTALTTLGSDPDALVRQATATSSSTLSGAQAALAAAIAEAMRDGLAGTPLPALPRDYVAGMDLVGTVKVPKVPAFPLPSYGSGLALPGLETKDIVDSVSPVVPPSGLHAPPTGSAAVDATLAQLLNAYGALAKSLDALNNSSLPALPVDGLVPSGLVPPVPGLGGGSPSQVQDANDAADPDEDGADLSRLHATELLGSVEGATAVTQPSLAKLLATYQGLAAQVQALVEEAHNTTMQGEATIQAQLEERIATVEAAAEKARAEALQLAQAHRRSAEALVGKAQAALAEAAGMQATAIQEAVAGDVGELQKLATQAQAAVAERKAQIQKVAQDAMAAAEASGGDVASIQAAGEAALRKVGLDGQARVQVFTTAATELQARAQAALRQLARTAASTAARVNDTLEKELQRADDAEAYLVALADAQEKAMTDALQDAANAALAKLPQMEQARVGKVLDLALKATDAAAQAAGAVNDLADRVGALTQQHVGSDIHYIGEVSKDYGRVPTGERLARAQFWAGIAGAADKRLDAVLAATGDLESTAQKVVQAAALARAQIEALA